MNIGDATRKRIINLCKERNITINKLSTLSGVTQSTIDNLMKGNSKTPTLQTVSYICEGLDMKLSEFFDNKIFDNLDDE